MAIKVGGTTVIDDSRQLTNIASVDAATVTALSNAGIGGGGTFDFVASGAISTGQAVSLNSDGTVSVSTATGGGSAGSVGTDAKDCQATFDSNSNKVVVCYKDDGNNYLKAAVGTVSGSTISFGAPVTVEAANHFYPTLTFDSNSNKVVIVFSSTSGGNGRSYVGTVSGTSISFGSMVQFFSGSATELDLAFDTTSNKVVVVFRDGSSNAGKYCVGTVSGTSISWGSVAEFTGSVAETPTVVYNSTENKFVVFYLSTSNLGQSRVGTLSGTTISWGAIEQFSVGTGFYHQSSSVEGTAKVLVIYRTTSTGDPVVVRVGTISGTTISYGNGANILGAEGSNDHDIDILYDQNTEKAVVLYRNRNTSSAFFEKAATQVGTISGTSISFPGQVYGLEAAGTSGNVEDVGLTYDSNFETFVAVYKDRTTGNSGLTSNTFKVGSGDRFIGLSTESVSDAATGTFNILGGVNEGLTGLTAGAQYYLSSPTPGGVSTDSSSSIKVGRALATDRLLVTEGNKQ